MMLIKQPKVKRVRKMSGIATELGLVLLFQGGANLFLKGQILNSLYSGDLTVSVGIIQFWHFILQAATMDSM